jgi:hypothetical protein
VAMMFRRGQISSGEFKSGVVRSNLVCTTLNHVYTRSNLVQERSSLVCTTLNLVCMMSNLVQARLNLECLRSNLVCVPLNLVCMKLNLVCERSNPINSFAWLRARSPSYVRCESRSIVHSGDIILTLLVFTDLPTLPTLPTLVICRC